MRKAWRLLATAALGICGYLVAQVPGVEIRVTAVDPESPAVLHSGNSLSVRVAYKADQVLHIQAAGYLAGRKIPGGMNGSPGYGPGEGETIAWIFFSKDEAIDEVRVVAHDARWKPLTEASVKVDARWSPGAPQAERAAWVRELNDAQQKQISADMQRVQSGPLAKAGSAAAGLLFLAVPGYFILQILLLLLWHGGWRRAAAAPLLIMVPDILFCLYALAKGSNLWPITLIFFSPVGLIYLIALLAFRKFSARSA